MTRFRLTLESVPSDVPAEIRLRGLLKLMLRSFGLRCVEAKELTDGEEESTEVPASELQGDGASEVCAALQTAHQPAVRMPLVQTEIHNDRKSRVCRPVN
jgi:hypothetical protein